MLTKREFKVIEVTRYMITRYEEHDDGGNPSCHSIGLFSSKGDAETIVAALSAKSMWDGILNPETA